VETAHFQLHASIDGTTVMEPDASLEGFSIAGNRPNAVRSSGLPTSMIVTVGNLVQKDIGAGNSGLIPPSSHRAPHKEPLSLPRRVKSPGSDHRVHHLLLI
jgi:hypothetical protein